MGWHPSGVTRTRIRIILVNFSEVSINRGLISLADCALENQFSTQENWI